jgi:hypothetical protein
VTLNRNPSDVVILPMDVEMAIQQLQKEGWC